MWEIEFLDEFGRWWETLTEDEQASLDASIRLLEELDPTWHDRIRTRSTAPNTRT